MFASQRVCFRLHSLGVKGDGLPVTNMSSFIYKITNNTDICNNSTKCASLWYLLTLFDQHICGIQHSVSKQMTFIFNANATPLSWSSFLPVVYIQDSPQVDFGCVCPGDAAEHRSLVSHGRSVQSLCPVSHTVPYAGASRCPSVARSRYSEISKLSHRCMRWRWSGYMSVHPGLSR